MKFLLVAKPQKTTPEASHRELFSDEPTRQGEGQRHPQGQLQAQEGTNIALASACRVCFHGRDMQYILCFPDY